MSPIKMASVSYHIANLLEKVSSTVGKENHSRPHAPGKLARNLTSPSCGVSLAAGFSAVFFAVTGVFSWFPGRLGVCRVFWLIWVLGEVGPMTLGGSSIIGGSTRA